MGTTALADAKSALSLTIAHNMDNVQAITNKELWQYMGLDSATGKDASGSKFMTLQANTTSPTAAPTAAGTGSYIIYQYTRGGVILECAIDLTNQTMTWNTNNNDAKRVKALADGLKITAPAASGTGTTVTGTAKVGTIGIVTTLKFAAGK